MNALILAGVAVVALCTGARVVAAAVALAGEKKHMAEYRDFVDAFAVELLVGARAVEAAEQALTPGHRITDRLGRQVRRIRLGGRVAGAEGEEEAPKSEGAGELGRLLRLWEVADRHGLKLGHLMRRFVEDIDARLAHLGHTQSALAGARLTETILLLLPVGALALGQSMGLEPVSFLTGDALGAVVLLVGTVLACAGVLWVESLTVTVLGGVGGRAGPGTKAGVSGRVPGASATTGTDALVAARVLDVFAAALQAGMPVAAAWRAAVIGAGAQGTTGTPRVSRAPAASALLRVSRLLELGAGDQSWESLSGDPCFGPVARRAAAQVRNGGRMAEEVTGQADRLRRQAEDRARAGAERVLVAVAAPLTLCFLPAFVLVGLVPLVVGFAGV